MINLYENIKSSKTLATLERERVTLIIHSSAAAAEVHVIPQQYIIIKYRSPFSGGRVAAALLY